MTTLDQKFSANVRALRAKRQFSQDRLAGLVDMSVSYVSMLENGKRSPPLATIERFAVALGVSPLKLLA